MPKLEYFVVADSVSIDQSTNEVSVFNIWEEINTDDLPTIVPRGAAITLWNAEPGDAGRDFQSMLVIRLPDGAVLQSPANFTMSTPRHRVTQRFVALPVTTEGEIVFSVMLNGELKATHTVSVRRVGSAD